MAAQHSGCRFWTAESDEAYMYLLREADELRSHEDCVALLRARSCDAVARNDPASLAAVMALADARPGISTELRFATAIASMAAKKYECAYAAWDDNGACWCSASDDPWIPDSAKAASVLMRVCHEASCMRNSCSPGSLDAFPGDESELCRLMSRMNTGAASQSSSSESQASSN